MSSPLISVVVPTYHRNDLLARCLERLAPGVQSLSPDVYEVIVTDDGSEGNAKAMVEERFPWAIWSPGAKKGPAGNRNSGARLARGKWIAFTDDDCVPSDRWLESFASAIENSLDVYEGKTTCEEDLNSPLFHSPMNLEGGYLWSCNMMVSTALFGKLGGFDERFPFPHMEDVEFRERLKPCSGIKFVEEAIVDHPPRLVPMGFRVARQHESRVYYDSLKNRATSYAGLLLEISKTRVRTILRHRFSLDSVRAIGSFLIEIVGVVVMMPSWRRKYSTS